MPNLLLTNYCNKSCPYCFAQDKKASLTDKKNPKKFISPDNLEIVLQYIKRSNIRVFSVFGGEPTLHPDFISIMERILKENLQVRLYTNGLIPEENLAFLESRICEKTNNITVILNVHDPRFLPEAEWKRIQKTLNALSKGIILTFNIYEITAELDFLIDLILRYDLSKNIRLGLAKPIAGEQNQYFPAEHFSQLAQKIVAFSDQCDKHNIRIALDCGFVLCMFSESQLGKILYNNVDFSFHCGSMIDIGPDLNVWKCFPLSKVHNVSLGDFSTENEFCRYYSEVLKPYRRFGIYDRCFQCKYLQRGQCAGGCIAYKMKTFKGL